MHLQPFHLIPCYVAAQPTPAQFWAVLLWGVIPAIAGIWVVYRHQEERLRRAHRRLRQLEARLAAIPVPQAPVSSKGGSLQSYLGNPRPSALTTRVMIPPVPGKPRGYTQPVPGPSS
jgi:hypothetical protein